MCRAGRSTRCSFSSISTIACSATVRYVVRVEPGVQTPEETLQPARALAATARGCWCRCCATLGSPARFVSGYLIQLKPDVAPPDGRRAPKQDVADLHAWAEVYLPGAGWIGLDATSGLLTRRGPHPACRDAAFPVRGADHRRQSSRPKSTFSLRDEASPASPRRRASRRRSPTRPGRHSTRSANKVDADLAAQDVRLTMGGEPTFVSIDDYRVAGMEYRGARADEARARRRTHPAPARALRAGGLAALRAGQMVSGRERCRAGRSRSIGGATASRSGATRPDRARGDQRARPARGGAGASRGGRRSGSASSRRVQAAFEDPAHWMLEEASFRSNVDAPIRNCSMRRRAPAWCARSSAGWHARRLTSCRCSVGTHGDDAAG